jgi:general secretion pathway protein M
MIAISRLQTYAARFPIGAALLYVVLVTAFVAVIVLQVIDLDERRSAVAAAADVLGQLEGRGSGPRYALASDAGGVRGSPFLEGSSVTVAGAALLQRIAGAVSRVGGNVLSSQVDVQGPQSKQGFVSVTASCELDQPALQQLLYDLEAGMPFLFVDQLAVQAPAVSASNNNGSGGKLRVLVSVSGQWQGTK